MQRQSTSEFCKDLIFVLKSTNGINKLTLPQWLYGKSSTFLRFDCQHKSKQIKHNALICISRFVFEHGRKSPANVLGNCSLCDSAIDAGERLIRNQWLPRRTTISIYFNERRELPRQHRGRLITYPKLWNDLSDKEAKEKVLQGFPKKRKHHSNHIQNGSNNQSGNIY